MRLLHDAAAVVAAQARRASIPLARTNDLLKLISRDAHASRQRLYGKLALVSATVVAAPILAAAIRIRVASDRAIFGIIVRIHNYNASTGREGDCIGALESLVHCAVLLAIDRPRVMRIHFARVWKLVTVFVDAEICGGANAVLIALGSEEELSITVFIAIRRVVI
jgi:hypothetical protein